MRPFRKKTSVEQFPQARSRRGATPKTIIIHHYCPHTFNVGDHFVIRSIRKHLARFLPQAIFVPKACAGNRGWGQPVRLQGENITFSNRYADAVLVGGSDQYNNWALRIHKDEIQHLQPPLYLVGMGVSSKGLNQEPHFSKASYLDDIRATHKAARLSSVRDTFTRDFLKGLGFDHAVVTGCPAMHLENEAFHVSGSKIVALTFPFPVIQKDSGLYLGLMERIRSMLDTVRAAGLEPVISCHDDRDVSVAQEAFPQERIFFSNDVDTFLEFYRGCSVVIGSRLHASITAAGLGIPFININLDIRGQGFSKTFGLEEWNLNADDPNLDTLLAQRLHTILKGELGVFEDFKKIKDSTRIVFLEFMENVARDIQRRA